MSLYESVDVWDQELQLGQKNLARAILDFWPDGIRSVLDVGCGDGKITRILSAGSEIFFCGLDRSQEALSRLAVSGVRGDVPSLPFGNNAFDLVLTTDVFEHLTDEQEGAAWSELFRVAKDWIYFAVPFGEELLEATAICDHCGVKYHVNWHQRRYDILDLTRRVPPGWRLAGIVLSGEPWSPMLPPEIAYRRVEMNEWSGWSGAVCPECGAAGRDAESPAALPQELAKALGRYTYEILSKSRFLRNHSEILAIYCRDGLELDVSRVTRASVESRRAAEWGQGQAIFENIVPYPPVARMVLGAEGGYILQLPVYPGVSRELVFYGSEEDVVQVVVEDGDGLLFDGEIKVRPDCGERILLPRDVVSGYYGLLVRMSSCESLRRVALEGESPVIQHLTPGTTRIGYHCVNVRGIEIFIQVPTALWIDGEGLFSQWDTNFSHVASVKLIAEHQFALERERAATRERIGELEAQYRAILEKKILGRKVSKWLGC